MTDQDRDVFWCEVCSDHWDDNRIDLLAHLHEDHTLKERLDALVAQGQRPEMEVHHRG